MIERDTKHEIRVYRDFVIVVVIACDVFASFFALAHMLIACTASHRTAPHRAEHMT